MVRAKFRLDRKTETVSGYEMIFTPVTGGSPENASFYKWTPGGKLEMSIVSSETAKEFEVGKEYYLDFTPAA